MTQGNQSRTVSSSQESVHPRLDQVVDAHFSHPWKQPLHLPSVRAFEALEVFMEGRAERIVLDSGCGNGESTRLLAQLFPEHTVIGVDKSLARLATTGSEVFPHCRENAVWLRADLPTFWRLARQAGWRLERHYLLYPNPWPKPGQLRRRWHAHPVFPDLLALGGRLEMRCNWEIYALEFAAAVSRVSGLEVSVEQVNDSPVSSPFEKKYRNSGHPLFAVSASLTAPGDRAPG